MTRKPDGYVPLLDDGTYNIDLLDDGARAIPVYLEKSNAFKPVCLCDPRLLDWVEHMRAILKLQPKPRIGDWDWQGLLERLNAILPLSEANNSKSEDKSNE